MSNGSPPLDNPNAPPSPPPASEEGWREDRRASLDRANKRAFLLFQKFLGPPPPDASITLGVIGDILWRWSEDPSPDAHVRWQQELKNFIAEDALKIVARPFPKLATDWNALGSVMTFINDLRHPAELDLLGTTQPPQPTSPWLETPR